MISSFAVLFALSASPAGVYFFQDGAQLYRAVVQLEAGAQSGAAMANVSRFDLVKVPGAVVGHQQQGDEDVVVACVDGALPTDVVQDCDVFQVDAQGAVRALGVKALTASLLSDGRVLTWSSALEVKVGSQLVARHAFEPHANDLGVIGIGVDPRMERFEAGMSPCPFVLRGEALSRVEGPCEAQAPFVSASGAVAYVSWIDGVASLYVGARGEKVARVGVGARADSPQFVPVPGSQWQWLTDDKAVYTAHYADETLWLLDISKRAATPLGRGREPQLRCSSGACLLFAVDGHGDGRRIVQYEVSR